MSATLTFPSPTLLKNVVNPTAAQDAATKNYVDQAVTNPTGTVTVSNIIVTGDSTLGNTATANYFSGNGSTLTSVSGSNVTGQVSNSLVSGTVYSSSQPNITSVGNLTTLTVNGAVNLGSVSNVKISGGSNTYILSTDGNSNLSWIAQPAADLSTYATQTYVNNAISNLVNSAPAVLDTLGELSNALGNDANFSTTISSAIGNKLNTSDFGNTANTWLSTKTTTNLAEGTNFYFTDVRANTAIDNRVTKTFVDNLAVVANIANVAYSVAGANVSGQVGNALIAGTVYTNSQPNITSVGTLTSLAVTGNITSGNANLGNVASANFLVGNASLLSSLTGANVTGFVPNADTANTALSVTGANVSGQVGNALIAGTVYTNSQPNITSIGTLTSLNVTGNLSFTGSNVSLGNVSNLKITGGNANFYLKTDGTGNLSWSEVSSGASQIIVDSFTGNGSQTTFTLSTTPSNVNSTTVNYNGATLLKDSYSLNGANITFGSAPANGAKIEITTITAAIGGGSYGNTEVAAYLPTHTGNLSANIANITTLNIAGNIIPTVSNTYSLGNSTNRFKDLYLQGNTIYLGDRTLSADDVLPFDLTIAPEVLTINVDGSGPGNDIMWLWTWQQSTLPYARTTITNQQQIQVPLYKQGTYQVNNFANEQHGNLDTRHMLYLKWVDGAGLDNLVSWANNVGNVTHSHPSINGGANTTVQRTNINVPATITVPNLTLPTGVYYNVAANGSSAFSISGMGVGQNRNIGPLYRGATYTFNLDTSLANHPFYITTDNGTGFVSGQYVGEYTTGVTGSRGNGQPGYTTLTFTVPQNAPDTLYYQCGVHSMMRGAITIKDLAVETNINGNYVLYFQHMKEGHKTPVEIRPIPAMVNQMCLVYDATTNQFVPQDMSTYIENTPSFKNKIQEVAGTATLIAPSGVAVVPTVLVIEDVSYLPLVNNNEGDIAFDAYTDTIYVWEGNAWRNTKPNLSSYATQTFVNNSIANLVNSAPALLDTLGEISNALGNDASFSTTITNSLANKLNTNAFSNTANTWISTQTTSNLSEGTNQYFTTARANTAIDNRVTKSFVDNLAVVANIANTANSVSGSNVSGQVGNALIAGTVYTNSQPNITSVGTLNNLTATGTINLTGASNVSLGTVNNLKITGGSANFVLTTDGSGNLSWAAQSAPSTVSTYVNFSQLGSVTSPFTGTTRFYPPKNITITKVYAHLSTASVSGALTFIIKKNGTSIGTTFSIAQNVNVMTVINVNVSLLTTDYLTLDITGGSATDLFVKLEY